MAIDDTIIFDPLYDVETISSAASGITPIQQFEPVLNKQAATSFVIIAIVFTLLQLRINAVSNAAKRRSDSLEALRRIQSLQLSSDVSVRPSEEQVTKAKYLYETALIEELKLRTIIPGVRIVAPNDPKRDEEERANAKRFLGWENDDFGDDESGEVVDTPSLLLLEERRRNNIQRDDESNSGISNTAKVILLGVASMLLVLLYTLSFDPMVADKIFTTLGGDPPSNMPLSSWS